VVFRKLEVANLARGVAELWSTKKEVAVGDDVKVGMIE
jgi:hypothetical protein